MSATRSRSACVRAVSGEIEVGEPRTPSTYGRAAIWGVDAAGLGDDAFGDEASWKAGAPIRAARRASNATSVPTTTESVRVIGLRLDAAGDAAACPSGGDLAREDVRHEREDDEQDEQDDRELPQSTLDAAAATVHGRVAAERAGQTGATRLEQDRGDQRDADDDLAEAEDGV